MLTSDLFFFQPAYYTSFLYNTVIPTNSLGFVTITLKMHTTLRKQFHWNLSLKTNIGKTWILRLAAYLYQKT